ncbi:hypothetical protein [Burkholderia gladioli]|uniref:hypothetical protein n=1 Tax=Burkholderia gladioli TaxID=28095 RepID=UPI00163EDF63|nr:hypothetical protein [Burkholderia gladioli]URV23703.1 hypothetical protein NAL90_12365 [Burkholderia gladioli]
MKPRRDPRTAWATSATRAGRDASPGPTPQAMHGAAPPGRLGLPGQPSLRGVLLGLLGAALLAVTFAAWLTPSSMLALLTGFSLCG